MNFRRWATALAPVLGLSLTLGAALPAAAQDEAAAEDAVEQTASRQLQGLEEITVTARKRAEDLQTVPVSISTITARDFENQSLQLFEDIQFQTPGLNIRQTVGRKHILGAMIRGFFELDSLITTDPAIGFYIDDIYSARISGTNMSLFDIDRIETLKGPQGVLFGKNNIGGAIKVHSKQPDGTTGGFGRVRLGTHGQTDFEGAVSFPIRAETLSARVAFLSHHRDGVSEHLSWPPDDALCGAGCLARAPANSVPDSFQNNALGGRVSLLYTPSDRFEALLQVQRLRSREPDPNPAVAIAFDHNSSFLRTGIGAGWTPVDLLDRVLEDNEPWDSYTSFKGQVDLDVWAYTYNMTWDFDSFSIRSLSGWRKFTTDEVRDQDGTPWNLRHTASETGSRQFTQELQINGTLFEDRLTYTSGVFWGNERTSYFEGSFGSFFGGSQGTWGVQPAPTNTIAKARGFGIYGHGSYTLSDRVDFWAGVRTTYDRREMTRFFTADRSLGGTDNQFCIGFGGTPGRSSCGNLLIFADQRYDAVTWGAGLDFQVSDDVFTYLKVDKGFRAGGVNGRGSGAIFAAGGLTFNPEFLTMWETGVKADWLDNRLRTNLAIYTGRYTNVQTTVFIPLGPTSITSRGNSGSASVHGGELEVTALPLTGLQLRGGIGVSKFKWQTGPKTSKAGVSGTNRLGKTEERGTPELTANFSARYTTPPVDLDNLGEVEFSFQVDWAYRSDQKGESQACSPRAFNADSAVDQSLVNDLGRQVVNGLLVHPCTFPVDSIFTDSYGVLNARVSAFMPKYNLEFALWGRNLADEEYEHFKTNFNTTGALGFVSANYGEPARYGFDVTYRFGSDAD